MVFVLELDESDPSIAHRRLHDARVAANSSPRDTPSEQHDHHEERPNPNLNGFSAALCCYPVVSSLARHLDLNSLHALSLTCRQFRGTLLLFRHQLVARTLRCVNEQEGLNPAEKLAAAFKEGREAWRHGSDRVPGSPEPVSQRARLTSGRVGKCARDMVGECRRCGTVVCRNCTAKPPPTPALAGRHRRLCHTCHKAPLSSHLTSSLLVASPRGTPRGTPASLSRTPTNQPKSPSSHQNHSQKSSFTSYAFSRNPCLCSAALIWLCTSCGVNLRSADTLYARGWTWRTAYSSFVGVSEGTKGVECGRSSYCLAARLVEQEVDCSASALRALEEEAEKVSLDGTGRSWSGLGGFEAQEVHGIGGRVSFKHRRLVRVGAEVAIEEDEDVAGSEGAGRKVLDREVKGEVRSWCAWCERVIPSADDGWDSEWELDGC